jgi:hypothetical protein
VNHYVRRSEQEYERKMSRPNVLTGDLKILPEHNRERRDAKLNAVRDDTIKAYLPQLREAIARTEAAGAARG